MKFKIILSFILVFIFLFSGYMVYQHFAEEQKQTDEFKQLAEIVKQSEESTPADEPSNDETDLPDYTDLYLQNSDMVGWISIDGTTINYPVMQSPNRPSYYLKHDFNKKYSDYGVPFVDEKCDLTLPCDNIIIYGHHMKSGKMFGTLESYKSREFYEQHKIICFDTLTEKGTYEIIAVFKTVAFSDKGFLYSAFTTAADENEFYKYVSKCKELSFYDTNLSAEYGDKLLTLSTCEYSNQNGRLVVVAKKITN